MRVAIIYGWSEGHWHGKRMRAALRRAGHTLTQDVTRAEAIIAHSAGCYQIPSNSDAKIIIMVGLPYWPDKSIRKSLGEKFSGEPKSPWWLKKTAYNTYYLITRPQHSLRQKHAYDNKPLPQTDATIVLVRNRHDSFMHPTQRPTQAQSWSTVRFDGHHDDLWVNPTPYVRLLDV